jgi:hypothetical protein
MALRLKYAGIESWSEPGLGEALAEVVKLSAAGETIYVVPTYTAMLSLLDMLLPGTARSAAWT